MMRRGASTGQTGRKPASGGGLRLATVLVAGALALTAGGCTGPSDPGPTRSAPTTPGNVSTDFAPGAPGIGDPYFPRYGNGGYDVSGYRLKVRYDPRSDQLTGIATVTATATRPLSRFNLDLAGLTVSRVTVDGAGATHRREGDELLVTPGRGLPVGTAFTAEVTYAGVPVQVGSADLGTGGWLATDDGAIALGQPESASTWFPVNDHPADKATYDIEVTVPQGLAAISNGVPGERSTAEGWTTWRWNERAPMASYLVTLVIGDYRVQTGTHDGRPMVTAIAASLPADGPAARSLARTGEIADFLAGKFGPYPFESYGGIAVADDRIRYALETQSRPVYGPAFFARGSPNYGVVTHELAHQWYGNSVSVARWSDIWLNEGFASYAEWLWEEHDGGRSVQANFDAQYAAVDWSKPTLDPGRAGLFTQAVYKRGALVLHAVRRTVGDDTFFRLLRTWAAEKRNGNATTAEFVAVAERVAGRPLRPLLDAWLSGTAAPPKP